MAQGTRLRVRELNSPEYYEGVESGWTGRTLNVQFPNDRATAQLGSGALLEIESETNLYLGVLQEVWPGGISILVEHSLGRTQLEWIQDVWG